MPCKFSAFLTRADHRVNSPLHCKRHPRRSTALLVLVLSLFFLLQLGVSRSLEPRTNVAADEDSPAIVKLVAGLFDEQHTAACAQLEKFGKPAVPALIGALSDPQTASVKSECHGFHPGGYSPFKRIMSLLKPFAPADAVRPLDSGREHQDSDFRKTAARAPGNIGTVNCVSPVLCALQDPDDDVRAYAMSGIDRGMNGSYSKSTLTKHVP